MSEAYDRCRGLLGLGQQRARELTNEENKYAFITPLPLSSDVSEKIRILDHPGRMVELRLPWADQTHEIVYESKTECYFVSQTTDSVLIGIEADSNGNLTENVFAWGIGVPPARDKPGRLFGGHCELHGLALGKEAGELLLTVQVSNVIMRVQAEKLIQAARDAIAVVEAKQIIELPYVLLAEGSSQTLPRNVGSPHVARQHPRTGKVWAGLKGLAVSRPGKELRLRDCECCDRTVHFDNYEKVFGEDFAARVRKLPDDDAFAIWVGDPENLAVD